MSRSWVPSRQCCLGALEAKSCKGSEVCQKRLREAIARGEAAALTERELHDAKEALAREERRERARAAIAEALAPPAPGNLGASPIGCSRTTNERRHEERNQIPTAVARTRAAVE